MKADKFFIEVTEQANGLIERVKPETLANETPCSEWNLNQLCNHVINELLWVPEILSGKTIAEVGDRFDGDLVRENFEAAWLDATFAAIRAVENTDMNQTVHLSYGDFPAEHYVAEVAVDVLIHSWDIGQSVAYSLIMKPELAQNAYNVLALSIQGYRDAGMVADEVVTDENADIQIRLLAIAGRKYEVAR